MAAIDPRLLDCDGEPELAENFNRILALIDDLSQEVHGEDGDGGMAWALHELDDRVTALEQGESDNASGDGE